MDTCTSSTFVCECTKDTLNLLEHIAAVYVLVLVTLWAWHYLTIH
jgi:hypothetical protein